MPALLAAILAFFAVRGFLAWQSVLALCAIGAVLAWLQAKSSARQLSALFTAAAVGCGFVAVQAMASHAARQTVFDTLSRLDPGARFIDAAMTAFPANPLCWSVVALQSREGESRYRISAGIVSIAPQWMPALSCPAAFIDRRALPDASAAVALLWRQDATLARLRRLAREDCHFNAWMRFARMPLLEGMRASDARFSSSLRDNFSAIDLNAAAGRACERAVPRWDYPRADLLAGHGPDRAGAPY